ncbi:MAG TPA: LysM peptidoglycan-binding domain-containing protein [Baekduia sp.]
MDMRFRLPVLPALLLLSLAAPSAASAASHLIVTGETLSGIAAANGLSPAQLAAANGLPADAFVIEGKTLTIPAPGTAPAAPVATAAVPAPLSGYRVRLGDSLSAIAAEHGVSLGALAAANGMSPEGTLVAGTSLRLPNGARPSTSPTTTTAGAVTTATSSGGAGGGHFVVPGDTLTGIAAANGITPASLASANGLSPNSFVIAGTHLRIPAAAPATSVPVTATTTTPGAAPAAAVPTQGAATGAPGRLSAAQIGSIAGANGAPASLATAIAWQESGFNNAMVSVANARGIMQVIPSTWSYIQNQLGSGPLDPNSAADNVRAGSLLLARLLRDSGGDPTTAVAAYYQGLGSVRRIGMLPETRRYVANVLALRSRFGG